MQQLDKHIVAVRKNLTRDFQNFGFCFFFFFLFFLLLLFELHSLTSSPPHCIWCMCMDAPGRRKVGKRMNRPMCLELRSRTRSMRCSRGAFLHLSVCLTVWVGVGPFLI